MSANIGVVRMNGKMYRITKAPFETDERLQDRSWYCARYAESQTQQVCPNQVMSASHVWANEKYFNMKYRDDDGNDHRS
jgi:hypothetical protein